MENKNYLNTAQMYLEAKNTNKTYKNIHNNLIYQNNVGLIVKEKYNRCPLEIWDNNKNNLSSLMEELWMEADYNILDLLTEKEIIKLII